MLVAAPPLAAPSVALAWASRTFSGLLSISCGYVCSSSLWSWAGTLASLSVTPSPGQITISRQPIRSAKLSSRYSIAIGCAVLAIAIGIDRLTLLKGRYLGHVDQIAHAQRIAAHVDPAVLVDREVA